MHRRVRRLALIGAVVATLAIAAPVGAITNGQADDDEHPHVGQLLFYVPSEAMTASPTAGRGSTARAR